MSRIIMVTLVAGAIAGCSASSGAAQALTLPAPEGFCALSRQQPADARMIDALSGMLAGAQISMLGISADCHQLEAWRTGKQLLKDFAQYQAPAPENRSDFSRSDWVKAYCEAMRAEHEKSLAGLTADVNGRMAAAKVPAKLNEMTSLGVLAEDSDACYTGMLQKVVNQAGSGTTQVAVTAGTLVKGQIVTYILYAAYRDLSSLNAALDRHKRNVAALLAANGG
jgi:hypothetical protein